VTSPGEIITNALAIVGVLMLLALAFLPEPQPEEEIDDWPEPEKGFGEAK
jgi:hypothetical protein